MRKKRTELEELLWRLGRLFEHSNCMFKRHQCKALPRVWNMAHEAYLDFLDEREALRRAGGKSIPWEKAKKKLGLRARVAGGDKETT